MPEKAIPYLKKLAENSRLIIMKNSPYSEIFKGAKIVNTPGEIISAIDKIIQPDFMLYPSAESIRYRHIIKGNFHYYIIFNEEAAEVKT